MSLYLIRPAFEMTLEAPAAVLESVPPGEGRRQWRPPARPRLSRPSQMEIRAWLENLENRKGTQVLKVPSEISAFTETVLAELTDEEVGLIHAELPEAVVLPDSPLAMIHAKPVPATGKERLDPEDLWHLDQIGLTRPRQPALPTGRGVRIAILDSGVDPSHEEVRGKVSRTVVLDTPNGTVRDVAVGSQGDPHGHGTRMASLICGRSLGVAPGAELVNVVMSPNGEANKSDFNLALGWVCGQAGIKIVNLSVGLPDADFDDGILPVISTLLAQGILPIISVGNDGEDHSRSPGNYAEPISVGATTPARRVADLSGGGVFGTGPSQYTVPDLVAPGDGVFAARPGGGYEAVAGTSASAAIVSGIAAMILESFPGISIVDWIEKLIRTCDDLTPSEAPRIRAVRQGSGLVQVPRFFSLANPQTLAALTARSARPASPAR